MAKKTKPAAEPKNGRQVPKEIAIKLSKDQCLQRANTASQLSKELTEAEEAFKEEETAWKQVKATFKANQKNLQDQIKKLLVEVKAQAAQSPETVLLVLNHDQGQAEYWYPISGPDSQIVETRPLEDGERQLSLVQEKVDQMPDDGQQVAQE